MLALRRAVAQDALLEEAALRRRQARLVGAARVVETLRLGEIRGRARQAEAVTRSGAEELPL